MNPLKWLYVRLLYFKIGIVGDHKLLTGQLVKLPCMDCGKTFRARLQTEGNCFVVENRCLEHRSDKNG